MADARPTKLEKLTESQETLLCKAYERPDHRVLGQPARTKETMVRFGYISWVSKGGSGHDRYVLTDKGIERAIPIVEARKVKRALLDAKNSNKDQAKIKADLLDSISDTLTNSDISSSTFQLPNGWKIRFDRCGPNKLIVQVVNPGQSSG